MWRPAVPSAILNTANKLAALNNHHTFPDLSGAYTIIVKGVAEGPYFGDDAGGVGGIVVAHCCLNHDLIDSFNGMISTC